MSRDSWDAKLYEKKHAFVWQLSDSVFEMLAPQSGESILDLGCGTGRLTARIADTGAHVVGLDNSPAMIEEARRLYPDLCFRVQDAHDFACDDPVDAVFSNAALHWMREPQRAVACIARALKPDGRFVAEFGGRANVQFLVAALETASQAVLGQPIKHPWYFPSLSEFALLLERNGMEVTQAALIERPTRLEGDHGLRNWVQMFGTHWLNQVDRKHRDVFLAEVESEARPQLFRENSWHADYRRLRVVAIKRST